MVVKQIEKQIDWRFLPVMTQWVIDKAVEIQQIPAPTFAEDRRADHVAALFREIGLESVSIDSRYNVYGVMPGQRRDVPGLMISAHTDTVFAAETDLNIKRDSGVIYGPGLGDNSMGVAGLLGLAEIFRREQIIPACDLWFVATSREEGLGDLGGMRMAFERVQPHVKAVINIEGLALGHVYHAGIAVRRLHITAHAAGGHSWIHFGRSSAVHGIIKLGARILTLTVPEIPRTTYNIGLIDGGQSINTISSQASLWLDMRSEQLDALAALEKQVREHITAVQCEDLHFEVEIVGDRPAGYLDPQHPLVGLALAALTQVGMTGSLETGSTDGNIPLSEGCPAVTIGITQGGNAHRLDEFAHTEPVSDGMRQLVILTLAAAQL